MARETAYARDVAEGVTAVARRRGWRLGLLADRLDDVPEHLLKWGADAVVTFAYNEQRVADLLQTGLPVVATNTAVGSMGAVVRVTADQSAVGRMAAEYLLGLGLRRLAVVRQDESPVARQRNAAFVEAVRGAGADELAVYGGPVHHGQVMEVATDSRALGAWLRGLVEAGRGEPVGVFGYWDAAARQVLAACQVAGLDVPRQVAVLGVDNDPLLCELADPPLSSIDLGARRIGEAAARVLEGLMDGRLAPDPPVRIAPLRVAPRLSTDLVAVDDPDVAAAVRYIRDHAAGPMTVADVAEHVMVADRKLERAFRKRMGLTMHAELTRQRMAIAKDLLSQTDLNLDEVARRCGYANGPHLSKTFKQHEGLTPGAYRRGA
jgi:LacI family transcriptional regulator